MGVFVTLFVSLVIFLFTLYTLSREDFVFIRKNITVEEIFNISFFTIPFIFFFSRLFFVGLDFDQKYVNPLVFLAIWGNPGLSLSGAVVGLVFGILLICEFKKITVVGRILDIFSLSFFAAIAFSVRINTVILSFGKWMVFGKELLITILFMLVFLLLFRFFLKEKFKDGSIALLFLLSFSFLSLLSRSLQHIRSLTSVLQGEGSVLVIVFVVSSILFLRREKVRFKLNFFKKR